MVKTVANARLVQAAVLIVVIGLSFHSGSFARMTVQSVRSLTNHFI